MHSHLNSYVHGFRLLTLWGIYSFFWFLKLLSLGFLIFSLFSLIFGITGVLGDYLSNKKISTIHNWENERGIGISCLLVWGFTLFMLSFNDDIVLFILKIVNPFLVYGVFTLSMVRYHKLPKIRKKFRNSLVESTKQNLKTHFSNFERLKEIPKLIEKKKSELDEIKNLNNLSDTTIKEKGLQKEIKILKKELKIIKKKYDIKSF